MSTSTCTHHTDSDRAACPVCLVAKLRADLTVAQNWVQHKSHHADDMIAENVELCAERDQLRAELATERARLDYVLKNDCAWNDRSEIDQDIKNMSAESKK